MKNLFLAVLMLRVWWCQTSIVIPDDHCDSRKNWSTGIMLSGDGRTILVRRKDRLIERINWMDVMDFKWVEVKL